MSKPAFSVMDRVYYTDSGPDDTGTVVYVWTRGGSKKLCPLYKVKWDNGDETDFYVVGQLARVVVS